MKNKCQPVNSSSDFIALKLIRQVRKNRFVIYMLTAYADDSADAKGERIFAVAGVMGTQEEWDELEVKWVARTDGKIFHATDCESGYGVYKNIQRDMRLKEYADLTKIIARSPILGYAAIVDLAGYNELCPKDIKGGPYFHCFVSAIIQFVRWTRRIIPQQTVKFVFDINHQVKYNAANLYENYLLKRLEYKDYTKYMDRKLGFATNEETGIQVADLFSHESMKHYYNIYFAEHKRHIRKSFKELINTDRFNMRYYDKSYFEAHLKRHEKELPQYWVKYNEWLSKFRRKDNANNRIHYLTYTDLLKE